MAADIEVIAEFPYQYTDAEGSEVAFRQGEKFLLLNKATEEWWKVKRISSDSSVKSVIYVPATYVKELPMSPHNTETLRCKSASSSDNHDYMNLDAFRSIMARSDSNTDSDYSYSDNDTASNLSVSPRVFNGSLSPTAQSSTAEIRKSLNLDAVLGGMLQQQGHSPITPRRSISRNDSNKENYGIKNAEDNVVLRERVNINHLPEKRCSSLPAGWQRLTDEKSGRPYYYNAQTDESMWNSPRASITNDETEQQCIPAGWTIEKDDSNEDIFVNSVNNDKWKAYSTEEGETYFHKIGDDITAWELPEVDVQARGARRRSLDDLPDDKTGGRMTSTFPRNSKARSVLFTYGSGGSQEDVQSEKPTPAAKLHRRSQSTSMLVDSDDASIPSISLLAVHDGSARHADVEGYLVRKKLIEAGKPKKFHWEQVYVCKYESSLLFYKDKKSSIPKPDRPFGRPESTIDLRGATLEAPKVERTKGKKHVFQICTYGRQNVMMLMADSPTVMGNWITSIQLTITNLEELIPLPPSSVPPEPPIVSTKSSSASQNSSGTSGSPTLLRREKNDKSIKNSIKRISKRGSNLSEEDANKVKIKAKLKKFLPKRPTYYELEKKGIIKQEVFGCHLEVLCKRESVTVPNFVVKCITAVEKRGLHVKGIYRECGNASLMHKLRISTDQGERIDFDDKQWSDVHVIAGALKWYFRELPEPLIPAWSFDRFIEAIKTPSIHERRRQFKSLIDTMPKYNYETLKFLLQHLLKVIEFSSENKMEKHNCSIVFGPTLLRPEDEDNHLNIALNTVYQNQIVNFVISEYGELFSAIG